MSNAKSGAGQSVKPAAHQCARTLFDGVPCDMPEHAGLRCGGCTPYVHTDLCLDHEPGCTAVKVTFTTEPVL